uniref:Lipocalin/cytosolic fatty-acid binding domain-containing protein n=1 Tax=Araucaria cunninghamii TaxID=56994 RepID=A0A0D6R1J4_ARACU
MGGSEHKSLEVVKGLDLERYMGRWYEIASMPSRFQPKNGVNTRATYALNDDGTVHVLNETWVEGKRSSIEGSAYKVDPKSEDAKFKVKFFVPPFLPVIPVYGNYWVMLLDQDYQWVLVGEPSLTSLWVLSRQPQLDEEIYNRLLEKAQEQGYDVGRLRKTSQTGVPDETEAPKDKGFWWIKALVGK